MSPDPAKLQMLIDREEIRDATLRYTRGIDRHDRDLLVSAYHSDARDDHGPFIGNREDFADTHYAFFERLSVSHQHHMTNQVIEIDGDTAHAESYGIVTMVRKDGTVDLIGSRYVDRLERRENGWAIVDRACLVEWTGELTKGANALPPDVFLAGRWDRQDISYRRPLTIEREDRNFYAAANPDQAD